ncbi:unnamed protein product [Paramecium octaurelia]|uniref:Uncharacterized protein n=1 Tax=Paramecium octaurelia TaxID=43137 RepID=A0A8S1X2Z4_PAROT|nr:unnamed protein product [Paramecium octaurelia]
MINEIGTSENPIKQDQIEIQLRQVKLNLLDEQNIQIQLAIVSNQNEMKQVTTIENIEDRQIYKLNYDAQDQILQILLINDGKQLGFSNQLLETLFTKQINEIKIIHEQIVVGVLSIQIIKCQNEIQIDSERLKEYLKQTGLEKIFMVIFAEILQQKIGINDVYKFAARRLREIGQKILNKQKQ